MPLHHACRCQHFPLPLTYPPPQLPRVALQVTSPWPYCRQSSSRHGESAVPVPPKESVASSCHYHPIQSCRPSARLRTAKDRSLAAQPSCYSLTPYPLLTYIASLSAPTPHHMREPRSIFYLHSLHCYPSRITASNVHTTDILATTVSFIHSVMMRNLPQPASGVRCGRHCATAAEDPVVGRGIAKSGLRPALLHMLGSCLCPALPTTLCSVEIWCKPRTRRPSPTSP